jgi:hypothetical protein
MSNNKIKINFVDFWHPDTEEAIKANPLYQLLSKRFDLELSDKPDFLIYAWTGVKHLKYNCVRIYYTGENFRPNFNTCDYAFSFDYPITDKNYRLPLYKLYDEYPLLFNRDNTELVKLHRKFCNFVYSNNKAQERIDFFNQLQKYKAIDSGGKSMNNIGYFIDDKISFLNQYKFTIAFENSSHPGYTTEKILHAFAANSIPIYWGNPLVAKDFNPKAFINCHDFENFEAVIKRIIEIDNNDELYSAYLLETPFVNNVANKYVDEDNIFNRFDTIFANKRANKSAKPNDIVKYYALTTKENIKKFLKNILHK